MQPATKLRRKVGASLVKNLATMCQAVSPMTLDIGARLIAPDINGIWNVHRILQIQQI